MKRILSLITLSFVLCACAPGQKTPALTPTLLAPASATPESDITPTPGPTSVSAIPPTPTTAVGASPTLAPDAWKSLPVVPTGVSDRVREIYSKGRQLGNQPNVFSLIGDCDATPTWFLGDFDLGPAHYDLGQYAELQDEITYFQGSFSRQSLAVRRGFVAVSVLTPLWSDPKQCDTSETPLACELRLNRPSFVFILLGTNDYNHREVFEPNMRKILDALIAQGVVPILATKADNMEGDYSLNATIARLAYEYQLPLWNFWAAVQPLPAHGLQEDMTHLTWAPNYFNDPARMQAAWPWRNLTALQTLDVVWSAVKEP